MEALSCAFDSSCMSILESSCSAGCTSDLEPARLGGICDNRPAGRSLHDCLVNNEDSYSDEPTCEEWESDIAGAVIGILVGVVIAIGLSIAACCMCCKNKAPQQMQQPQMMMQPQMAMAQPQMAMAQPQMAVAPQPIMQAPQPNINVNVTQQVPSYAPMGKQGP